MNSCTCSAVADSTSAFSAGFTVSLDSSVPSDSSSDSFSSSAPSPDSSSSPDSCALPDSDALSACCDVLPQADASEAAIAAHNKETTNLFFICIPHFFRFEIRISRPSFKRQIHYYNKKVLLLIFPINRSQKHRRPSSDLRCSLICPILQLQSV